MHIDRSLWVDVKFQENRFPAWPCPNCGRVSLEHDNRAFLFRTDKGTRKEDYLGEEWYEIWERHRVITILHCTSCRDNTMVIGTGETANFFYEDGNGNDFSENEKVYYPKYFIPALKIFEIPKEMKVKLQKSKIVAEIEKAFSLFWCDNESCANKIRNAVEAIMDYEKVEKVVPIRKSAPGTPTTKARKEQNLKLHARIEIFARTKPDIASHLMAVKWIGNSGSHAKPVTAEDLLDGFELLAYCLEELYGDREATLKRLSTKINKKKGPLGRV